MHVYAILIVLFLFVFFLNPEATFAVSLSTLCGKTLSISSPCLLEPRKPFNLPYLCHTPVLSFLFGVKCQQSSLSIDLSTLRGLNGLSSLLPKTCN